MDMRAVRCCCEILAAFCTWKLFPASVGTASVLKTLEIREGKTFDHFLAKKIVEGQISIKKLLSD